MPLSFNPLEYPILFAAPRRLTRYSTWPGHIPFAMLLVELLKPNVFVELGTFQGDSYCAVCQAVEQLHLPTVCYAVDTWRGDPQTGFYGPEVLEDLRAHHDALYGNFSQLIQSSFDDAQAQFAIGAIDLLHIDGCHTYETVKHDFECWQPKLSQRAVVLFHDISFRGKEFGARIFWDEIKDRYPSFEFFHSSGLGVLAVGRERPELLLELMAARSEDRVKLHNLFFRLGYACLLAGKQQRMLAQPPTAEPTADVEASDWDALGLQLSQTVNRVGELQSLLLDAHRQLLARDSNIEGLRESEAKQRAAASRQQDQMRRMTATKAWKLNMIYWRALALLRRSPRP